MHIVKVQAYFLPFSAKKLPNVFIFSQCMIVRLNENMFATSLIARAKHVFAFGHARPKVTFAFELVCT